MSDAPDDLVPATTTPSDLIERSHHRASWTAVVAIAVASTGAGVLVGSRLRGSTPSSPTAGAAGMPGTPGMPGMDNAAPAAPPGAGSNAVYISPGRQQLVGVRTALVDRQRVEGTVRTVGMLAYDETRTAQIHTRVSGWVEQLFVDYVGKAIRRGQPLFAVYSPDLATAQADYLVALKASQRLGDNTNPELKAGADALLAASRERMKRWDVSDAQIAELERAGHPTRTMTIASPFDGAVLEKNVFAGQYITPDMTSFKLADLSTIDTGERKYVLLALAGGYFEPRDVQLGPPIGELYPVVAGVAAGDRVVTSSQFLIDSETNLMAAMQGMAMAMPGMDMGKPAPAAGSAAPADPRMPDMPDMPDMPGMKMDKPAPTAGNAAPAKPAMPGM